MYPLPIGWGLDGGSQRIHRATNALGCLRSVQFSTLTEKDAEKLHRLHGSQSSLYLAIQEGILRVPLSTP